ncbi:uncharacterized protein TRAVEDRAFT_28546 [Trametes versicolor FP-101664 SS1]|uniref:uncharacterized protein n=1 Tax=Trametes versicolor (strain FP-101664) TaxID=717944 RepID=UPI000462363E|nr:uncharacterized protein TRAVEDRAFT_28546 [Trametes versicolor FP-101664 SS1]EIW59318.1 hypothetical protein TRAVEDRAFT_28546 [Trametes versicolor FP-101664 SS1]
MGLMQHSVSPPAQLSVPATPALRKARGSGPGGAGPGGTRGRTSTRTRIDRHALAPVLSWPAVGTVAVVPGNGGSDGRREGGGAG